MMYLIPVAEETLALIQVLNSGTPVTIEDVATCYLYRGENETAEILTEEKAREMFPNDDLTTITIGHRFE